MNQERNREIRLKKRPVGMPAEDDFEIVQVPVPRPAAGEALVRNIYMSVDPYMRGRMIDVESYVPPFQLGKPLEGGCVGQVLESRSEKLARGDYVESGLAWREFFVEGASRLQKIDPRVAPIQTYLGTLGMPGLTAYAGLLRIGRPQERETVFVSAAAGAVGSIVCQIARIKGCRVVGSAGSEAKTTWLKENAGVEEVVNYRQTDDLAAEIRRKIPEGIDIYFDNVGGGHLQAALERMKPCGRVVMCGMIAQYNASERPPGPNNLFIAIQRRLTLQGFIVMDHFDLRAQFLTDMGRWIREGRIRWRETILEGIENAPQAFIGLFKGENVGKMLVKIGPDPALQ